jgi:hypothetical protein
MERERPVEEDPVVAAAVEAPAPEIDATGPGDFAAPVPDAEPPDELGGDFDDDLAEGGPTPDLGG